MYITKRLTRDALTCIVKHVVENLINLITQYQDYQDDIDQPLETSSGHSLFRIEVTQLTTLSESSCKLCYDVLVEANQTVVE